MEFGSRWKFGSNLLLDTVISMKNISIITCAILINLVCISCSSSIEKRDLIGTFVADRVAHRDILEIHADGTYVHRYSPNIDGVEVASTNNWTFDSSQGEPRITFDGFTWGVDFAQFNSIKKQATSPGFWDVEVEKAFGHVRLRINQDDQQWYIKQ
jgi:hypothetical protein